MITLPKNKQKLKTVGVPRTPVTDKHLREGFSTSQTAFRVSNSNDVFNKWKIQQNKKDLADLKHFRSSKQLFQDAEANGDIDLVSLLLSTRNHKSKRKTKEVSRSNVSSPKSKHKATKSQLIYEQQSFFIPGFSGAESALREFTDVLGDSNHIAKSFMKLSVPLTAKVGEFSNSANEINSTLSDFTSLLSRLDKRFANLFSELRDCAEVCVVIVLVTLISYLVLQKKKKALLTVLASTSAYFAIRNRTFLFNKLSEFCTSSNQLQPEADFGKLFETISTGTLLADMVEGCSNGLFSFNNKHKETFQSILSKLNEHGRAKRNISTALVDILNAVENVINFIITNFTSMSPIMLRSANSDKIESWRNRCQAILDKSHKSGLGDDIRDRDYCWTLLSEGRELRSSAIGDDASRHKTIIDTYFRAVETACQPLMTAFSSQSGDRVEPFVCLLRGTPGVGKSTLMDPICLEVLKMLQPEGLDFEKDFNLNHYIYTKNGDSPYFDGYKNQPIFKKDEMFQKQDIKGAIVSEAADFIAMVNSAPYPLNMANLTNKGAVYFRSPFFIGTTNILGKINNLESIREPDAVNRRISFSIVVKLKYEYTHTEVDPDAKLSKALNRFHPDILKAEEAGEFFTGCYLFDIRDETSDSLIQTDLDWSELIVTFRSLFMAHLRRQEKLLSAKSHTIPVDSRNFVKVGCNSMSTPYVYRNSVLVAQSDVGSKTMSELYVEYMSRVSRDVFKEDLCDFQDSLEFSDFMEFIRSQDFSESSALTLSAICSSNGIYISPRLVTPDILQEFDKWLSRGDILSVAGTDSANDFMEISCYLFALKIFSSFRTLKKWSDPVTMAENEHYALSHVAVEVYDKIRFNLLRFVPSLFKTSGPIKQINHDFIPEIERDIANNAILMVEEILNKSYPSFKLDRKAITSKVFDEMDFPFYVTNYPESKNALFHDIATKITPRLIASVSTFRYLTDEQYDDVRSKAKKFDSWCDSVRHGPVSKTQASLITFLRIVGAGVAAYTTYRAASGVLNYFWSDEDEEDEDYAEEYGEAYRSLRERRDRHMNRSRFRWRTSAKEPLKPESGCPNTESLHMRMDDNMYEFTVLGVTYGYAVAIKEDILMVPFHFVSNIGYKLDKGEITTDDDIVLCKCDQHGGDEEIRVPLKRFSAGAGSNERDVYLFRCDRRQAFKNLARSFCSREQVEQERFVEGTLHTTNRKNKEHQQIKHNGSIRLVFNQTYGGKNLPEINVDICYKYAFPTNVGDCGALLTAVDHKRNLEHIVGLHVAGLSFKSAYHRAALSTVVTKEDISEFIEQLEPHPLYERDDSEAIRTRMKESRENCSKDFPYPRYVEPKRGEVPYGELYTWAGLSGPKVNRPPGSNIKRSSLQLPWEPQKLPAALRPIVVDGVEQDPMYNAINRYNHVPKVTLPFTQVRAAVDDYFNFLRGEILKDQPDLSALSFEAACSGLVGVDFANGLSRSSSPGYPYSQWLEVRRKGGKKAFFGDAQEFDFDSESCKYLKRDVFAFLSSDSPSDPDHNLSCIYQDTLKDELLSKEKVQKVKTRLVSACPLHVTIAWRMMFMRLIVYLNNKRYDIESGVGVNCVSSEWSTIKNRLLSNSSLMEDGDQSGFDTNQHPVIQQLIFEKLVQLVNLDRREFPSAYENFKNSYIRSTHVCDGNFYRWAGSLPSGHPLTITFNCLYLSVAFRCAWLYNGNQLKDFRDNVSLITYGDDSILSVKEAYIDSFDHAHIAQGMASIGLSYTDAQKRDTDKCPRYKSIEEITFLKRAFRYDPLLGQTVAPLKLESILERVCWSSTKGDDKELMLARCNDSLQDLVLHGKETWEKYGPNIVDAYENEYNDVLPYPTWDSCLTVVSQQLGGV